MSLRTWFRDWLNAPSPGEVRALRVLPANRDLFRAILAGNPQEAKPLEQRQLSDLQNWASHKLFTAAAQASEVQGQPRDRAP